jgi:phage FluMu protein Com
MEIRDSIRCKKCGKVIDAIGSAKNEGHCHECFSAKITKLVHPF